MIKKLTKQGNELALIIDKSVLESLGIDEKTDLEIVVMGGNLIIKPKSTSKATKKQQKNLEDSAKRIIDKYGPVFKKLAKT
jgi:antitoxin component of MazEF toxin-antitoxin module